MAVFKCNEPANDQLIRLFVLRNTQLRVEELYFRWWNYKPAYTAYIRFSFCENPVLIMSYYNKIRVFTAIFALPTFS